MNTKLQVKDFITEKDINQFKGNYYGFYDWFCKNEKLEKIARSMRANLKYLVKLQIIDPDNTIVEFKNDFDQNNIIFIHDKNSGQCLGNIKIVKNGVRGYRTYKHNKIIIVAYDDPIGDNNSYWIFDNTDWKEFKDHLELNPTFVRLLGRIFRSDDVYRNALGYKLPTQ